MERREILIANSKDQSKYRILTDATTLGELQDAIARNQEVYKMVGQSWISNDAPINISGLTFTEGITKTQLLNRESLLPTNVMFKGAPTNNLVMLLTNTNKQIRSGAYPTNRKEFGEYIKMYNLGEAIKATFGDNWTRIKTNDLIAFFANNEAASTDSKEAIAEVREELAAGKQHEEEISSEEAVVNNKKKAPEAKDAPHAETVGWFYEGIKKMVKDNLLYIEDVVVLADLLTDLHLCLSKDKPTITVSDIDDMMDSIDY